MEMFHVEVFGRKTIFAEWKKFDWDFESFLKIFALTVSLLILIEKNHNFLPHSDANILLHVQTYFPKQFYSLSNSGFPFRSMTAVRGEFFD